MLSTQAKCPGPALPNSTQSPARFRAGELQLHLDAIGNKSTKEIADLINTALLEPMQEYYPLDTLPPFDPDTEVVNLSVSSVLSALLSLNPRKASGPDGLPNWVLKDYADFLADPVCSILNSSFA